MLKYTEFGISSIEVPNEMSLCIYIAGCINNCDNCHYEELQSNSNGLPLKPYFCDIVDLYISQASCVCILGEGSCSLEDQKELIQYSKIIRDKGLKSCLYSGRDTAIEKWMETFDYLKTGSYISAYGSLYDKTTNQRFYKKTENGYKDITSIFWK